MAQLPSPAVNIFSREGSLEMRGLAISRPRQFITPAITSRPDAAERRLQARRLTKSSLLPGRGGTQFSPTHSLTLLQGHQSSSRAVAHGDRATLSARPLRRRLDQAPDVHHRHGFKAKSNGYCMARQMNILMVCRFAEEVVRCRKDRVSRCSRCSSISSSREQRAGRKAGAGKPEPHQYNPEPPSHGTTNNIQFAGQ